MKKILLTAIGVCLMNIGIYADNGGTGGNGNTQCPPSKCTEIIKIGDKSYDLSVTCSVSGYKAQGGSSHHNGGLCGTCAWEGADPCGAFVAGSEKQE
jgi:hypothetical protein